MTFVEVPTSKERAAAIFKSRRDFQLAPRNECLVGKCRKTPVRCHSVSRNRLELFSDNGHILALQSKEIFKDGMISFDGAASLEEIGIGNATTFSGFCAEHDATLYKNLDVSQFEPTPNNCLLLAHRNFARQVSDHGSRVTQIEKWLTSYSPPPEPFKSMALRQVEEMKLNLKFIRSRYREIEKTLNSPKQKKFAHLIIKIEPTLGFAISTTFFPTYSILGESFGRDTHGWLVSLSIFPEMGHSLVVVTVRNQNFLRAARFLQSVEASLTCRYEKLPSALVLLSAIEGYPVFSNKWWESLDEKSRGIFKKACGLSNHDEVNPEILSPVRLPNLTTSHVVSSVRL